VKNVNLIITGLSLLLIVALSGCIPQEGQAVNGDTVQIHYTGKLADGTVFDSTVGKEPTQFTLGEGKVLAGFEKAVLGMKVGEKKTFTIPANEAYGPRKANLVYTLTPDQWPPDLLPEVGKQLQATRNDGSAFVGVITKVTDTSITVDANHPLAGKDLTFDIELVSIF
jgi:peptidylprolyl isomerase